MAWFQVHFISQSLKRTVSVNAFIPADPGVGAPQREEKLYKTLYLLHGYDGDHTHWMTNGRIKELSQHYELAVVMPSGENSFYVDIGRSGRLYSSFVGRELVEFTRRVFPLSRDRADTFIGGLSMGGYGALYNGLKYHDTFSHIIALSSGMLAEVAEAMSADPNRIGISRGYFEDLAGGDIRLLKESDKNLEVLAKQVLDRGGALPDLYIACGYNDVLVHSNRRFSQYLSSIGYPHVYEEGAGTHEWAFWNAFLPRGVDRLGLAPAHTPKTETMYWVDAQSDSPNPVTP